METATPMLRQYQQIKSQHKDCILFFRLGDFYEMFFDDAKMASQILDLVLTSRGRGTASETPMCGIPYHAAEGYIAKLIKAGLKVAICEQVEDPALAQGIVKRDVIRVITSGTYLDENSSDPRYLLCLNIPVRSMALQGPLGMAFMDPTTGTIQTNQFDSPHRIIEIMARLPIYECIYPAAIESRIKELFNHPLLKIKNIVFSSHDDWCFNTDIAQKTLTQHFSVPNLRGFGIDDMPLAISSSGALLEYLKQMNKQPLRHIDRIALYADSEYMYISPAATYGLEIESLFKVINNALSPMGKRKLHYWLYHPLKQPAPILQRQAAVTILKDQQDIQKKLREQLSRIPDIEKSISKLSSGYTHAKDLLAIRNTLVLTPEIHNILNPLIPRNRLFAVEDIPSLRELLDKAINPDLPLSNTEGKVIKKGFDPELDQLREIQETGNEWLKNFQAREIKRSGINSLKVGFNKVFGYYIEITNTNLNHVPADFIRKQTLVNAERFITPELKEYEEKILTAQDKILKIENRLILALQKEILDHSAGLHHLCQNIATIDVIYALSLLAQTAKYTAPEISEDSVIDIKDGRHPVVEKVLAQAFTPNDIYLDCAENHLIMLTGPNMAGKSTYIRQIALLVILAQMGSYIPATEARIGVVDKIFTRIGAHDDIAKGQSTFMVEMNEMADIINNLSQRSLIILDEIGRGTSTYDGLSLAWALAEHLQKTKARTLFATHFHELTVLAEELSGIKNYNVAVKEWKDEIIFLHKIVSGSSDDSYGIYVAKLAGIPKSIIARARKILTQLEFKGNLKEKLATTDSNSREDQISLFSPPIDPVMEKIKSDIQSINIDALTPIAALNKLQELKEFLDKEEKVR